GIMFPTAVGAVVLFIGFIFNLLLGFLSGIPVMGSIMDLMLNFGNLILSILGFIFFFFLFAWAGYITAKKYRCDVVEAGAAGAFSYAILALVSLLLDTITGVLQITGLLPTTTIGISGSAYEDIVVVLMGGGFEGAVGVALVLCCGLGTIPIGMFFNFVAGSIGGMLGSAGTAKTE
ncbi:hypothetical protein H0O02_00040, partial [Candidatus Micrarchaeota archaeon]|nr:hypothetical protein [Candidatus Micrarchaeota archaeon]